MTRPSFAGFALAIALLTATAAFAQGGGKAEQIAKVPPAERAKMQTMIMKEKLHLTEKELPNVEAINLNAAQQMQPVLESSDGPLIRMRKAKEIEDKKDAMMKDVLSPQQYQQYLGMKEEIKQKVEQKLMEKRAGGQ